MSREQKLREKINSDLIAVRKLLDMKENVHAQFTMLSIRIDWDSESDRLLISKVIDEFSQSRKLSPQQSRDLKDLFEQTCYLHNLFRGLKEGWQLIFCAHLYAHKNKPDDAIKMLSTYSSPNDIEATKQLLISIPTIRDILNQNQILDDKALNYVKDILKNRIKYPSLSQTQYAESKDYFRHFYKIHTEIIDNNKIKALYSMCCTQINWYSHAEFQQLEAKLKEYLQNKGLHPKASKGDWSGYFEDLLSTAFYYHRNFQPLGPIWKYIHFPYLMLQHHGKDVAQQFIESLTVSDQIADVNKRTLQEYFRIAEKNHLINVKFRKEFEDWMMKDGLRALQEKITTKSKT